MPVLLALGLQWGDEGKGKIVDHLARQHDLIIRFQGGPNAGHTIKVGKEKFIFHHIPSGILHPQVECLIGNGVIIDLDTLKHEIEQLIPQQKPLHKRLKISSMAHLILPAHKKLDQLSENRQSLDKKIGTTGRGIGPTYAAKYARTGLRLADLYTDGLKARLNQILSYYNELFQTLYQEEPIDIDAYYDHLLTLAEYYEPYIIDSYSYIQKKLKDESRILLEGAQGTMLDIEFGTYPFVTSSHCVSAGAAQGSGIPFTKIKSILGILKAYTTRVGNGPFPTELLDETGEQLRKIGAEFGSTTGRPRRCGWLDLVAARYAVNINGITELALTKLDVLDNFTSIGVCIQYTLDNATLDYYPAVDSEKIKPIYHYLPGWQADTSQIHSLADLPQAARNYIRFIEEFLNIPVRYVSTGADREQLIIVE